MRLENSMYRHHTGSQYTVMISKPPRPPSWRDFVAPEPPVTQTPTHPKTRSKGTTSSSSSKRASRDLEFTNLVRQQKSYSEGSDLSRLGVGGQPHYHGSYSNLHRSSHGGMGIGHSQTLPNPHTSKSGKRSHHRSHGRLHRTTSQYNIEQTDLPRIESMTLSLANTKLQKKGSPGFDPLIYLNENAKRCERWLQQVHASQPLEDVAFTSKPQLHIPEEGLDENELVKTPVELCSGSGSEVDSVSVCAANRSDLSDREREAHIRLPGGHHHPLMSDNSAKPNFFLGRPKPDLKDVAEESSSTYSNQNNKLKVSKENRDPSSVSSSSEEVKQQRNNRKNLSDHTSSPRDTRYVVHDRGEDSNDIKLSFTR